MRNCLFILVCGISVHLYAQQMGDKAFIFDPSIIQQYGTSINGIISVMANYYEGVEYSDAEKLDASFHSSWLMRDNDGTDNDFIHIEDKETFIERVKNHGAYEDYASQRKIGAIEVIHDQLAFVRIDKAPTRSATLFFLAKIASHWAIIDKLWVYQEEQYDPLPSEGLLLTVQNFYNGFATDDHFDSKVLSADLYKVYQESKLIDNDIKLISILGVYDRLAVIRTDYPALNTTAYMVLFRLNTGWSVACERISRK